MSKDWPLYVKREHIARLAVCWCEMAPKFRNGFYGVSREQAVKLWMLFRANPATQDPAVCAMKRIANEMWLLSVQSN